MARCGRVSICSRRGSSSVGNRETAALYMDRVSLRRETTSPPPCRRTTARIAARRSRRRSARARRRSPRRPRRTCASAAPRSRSWRPVTCAVFTRLPSARCHIYTGRPVKKCATSLQAEMAYEGALAGARCSTRVLVTRLVLNTARVPLAAALAQRGGPLGRATGVWIALSATTARLRMGSSRSSTQRRCDRRRRRLRREQRGRREEADIGSGHSPAAQRFGGAPRILDEWVVPPVLLHSTRRGGAPSGGAASRLVCVHAVRDVRGRGEALRALVHRASRGNGNYANKYTHPAPTRRGASCLPLLSSLRLVL